MLNHDDEEGLLYFDASQRRRCDCEVPRVVFPSDAPNGNDAVVVVAY